VTALEESDTMLTAVEAMVAAIKTEDLSLADARHLVHVIRKTQGWLNAARRFLDPAEQEIK